MAAWLRSRIPAAVAAILMVPLGLASRAWLSGELAQFLGVALWAALVYFLMVVVRPALGVARSATLALTISFAVEFAQLTRGPAYLADRWSVFHLIFGSTFDAWDLPAYVAGVAAAAVVDAAILRHLAPRH